MIQHTVFLFTILSGIFASIDVDRCTTIIASLGAGTDGPMTTHTADCSSCDFRVNKVSAKDWPEGSLRPLYVYRGEYPSTVSSERGDTWHPKNLEGTSAQLTEWGKESPFTAKIPQVKHTYAYIEGGYGIMNEHQVSIGESTCAAKLWGSPTIAGGKAKIEVRQMSEIALERSRTAREAVLLMGELATSLGFYAADWSGGDASKGEGGEALTVADKTEAWVFHVLGDDTGASAVWAAQRVPRGHVAAVANQFIIRAVNASSPDFLYSDNLWDVAKRNGFWSEADGALDFLKTFGPQRAHSPYCTRRVWRVFNLVAPSIPLPPDTDPLGSDYPFSVPVDKPLSPADMMRIQRDHYEGTAFDLTKGLAAGPYGDPNRFDPAPQPGDALTATQIAQGSYERAISLFRTSYSFVATSRSTVPDALALLWYTVYAPSSSSYTPLYVAATTLPPTHTRGSLFRYDSSVAFWNFLAVGNYASRFYKFAMKDVVAAQKQLQDNAFAAVDILEEKLKPLLAADSWIPESTLSPAVTVALTALTLEQATAITLRWNALFYEIIAKFHDGYIARDTDTGTISMQKLFYPEEWLNATGFFNNRPNSGPDVILFASNTTTFSPIFVIILSVILMVITLTAGILIGKHSNVRYFDRKVYTSIDI